MKIIKGLIVKDILQLKSYWKSLALIAVIFILSAIPQDEGQGSIAVMLPIMMAIGFGMFSIASFNYDESSKADRYLLTLPVNRKDIVLAKYILTFCATAIGTVLGVVTSLAVLIFIKNAQFDMSELLLGAIGGMFGIGLIQSIQIPCIYKMGAEKGRIFAILIAMVAGILAGSVAFITVDSGTEVSTSIDDTIIGAILGVAMLISYFISYLISCRIFEKKEM